METWTPAHLALELGTSQKQIRDFLRAAFGILPDGVTRWALNDVQVEAVRTHFSSERIPDNPTWPLEPGDTVRRRDVHRAFGGQQQSGISTPHGRPFILVFTNPRTGAKFGYDKFEGLMEDGTFAYTGEGQYGPQVWSGGNAAIRDSALSGRTLQLFRTDGPYATYVGSFTTDEPAFRLETIPDADGNPRDGFIFNLIPLSADVRFLPAYGGEIPKSTPLIDHSVSITAWYPPDSSDISARIGGSGAGGLRPVSRLEFALQRRFGEWLEASGHAPQTLRLRVGSSVIQPDFYVPSLGWIVEAKKSTARAYVREAIGQVLDYVHSAKLSGVTATPVVLLPGAPESDLLQLMETLKISVIARGDEGFDILNAG